MCSLTGVISKRTGILNYSPPPLTYKSQAPNIVMGTFRWALHTWHRGGGTELFSK